MQQHYLQCGPADSQHCRVPKSQHCSREGTCSGIARRGIPQGVWKLNPTVSGLGYWRSPVFSFYSAGVGLDSVSFLCGRHRTSTDIPSNQLDQLLNSLPGVFMLQGIESCRAIYFASWSSRDSCPEAAALQGLNPVTRLLLDAPGIQRALCWYCALSTLSCVSLGAQSPGPDVSRYLVLGAIGWESYTPLLARRFWKWTPCSWIKSNAIRCNVSFQPVRAVICPLLTQWLQWLQREPTRSGKDTVLETAFCSFFWRFALMICSKVKTACAKRKGNIRWGYFGLLFLGSQTSCYVITLQSMKIK